MLVEKLEMLKGQFWTAKQELIEEIEELGFEIEDENEEIITVVAEDEEYTIYLINAGHTIAVDKIA